MFFQISGQTLNSHSIAEGTKTCSPNILALQSRLSRTRGPTAHVLQTRACARSRGYVRGQQNVNEVETGKETCIKVNRNTTITERCTFAKLQDGREPLRVSVLCLSSVIRSEKGVHAGAHAGAQVGLQRSAAWTASFPISSLVIQSKKPLQELHKPSRLKSLGVELRREVERWSSAVCEMAFKSKRGLIRGYRGAPVW